MQPTETKTRLLDAAERCFAQSGYAAASLREITQDAGVNLAAANYHFGTKEALYLAVFARRTGPLNEQRLLALDQLELRCKEGRLPLEPILDAFLRPALVMAADPQSAQFMRIVGRMSSESTDLCERMDELFHTVKVRFLGALQRALPTLTTSELFWRTHLMVGAMLHTMNDHERLRSLSKGLCDPTDVEGTLAQVVPFFAAGFRAAGATDDTRTKPTP